MQVLDIKTIIVNTNNETNNFFNNAKNNQNQTATETEIKIDKN